MVNCLEVGTFNFTAAHILNCCLGVVMYTYYAFTKNWIMSNLFGLAVAFNSLEVPPSLCALVCAMSVLTVVYPTRHLYGGLRAPGRPLLLRHLLRLRHQRDGHRRRVNGRPHQGPSSVPRPAPRAPFWSTLTTDHGPQRIPLPPRVAKARVLHARPRRHRCPRPLHRPRPALRPVPLPPTKPLGALQTTHVPLPKTVLHDDLRGVYRRSGGDDGGDDDRRRCFICRLRVRFRRCWRRW